jgi:hypothetical protein
MNSIYKTPWGLHIDLDHLQAVSDTRFVDRMGSGGFFVEADLWFALRDKPIVICKRLDHSTDCRWQDGAHFLALTDGTWLKYGSEDWIKDKDSILDGKKLHALFDIQKEVNEVLKEWEDWKRTVRMSKTTT